MGSGAWISIALVLIGVILGLVLCAVIHRCVCPEVEEYEIVEDEKDDSRPELEDDPILGLSYKIKK